MAAASKVKAWRYLCFAVYIGMTRGAQETMKSRSFIKEASCRLQDRIDNGCAEQKQGVFKSLLACASVCQDGCLGFVKGDGNTCYTYKSCGTSISCKAGDDLFNLYKERVRVCQNGGVLSPTANKCKCVNNWVGESCERHPKSCRELLVYGYSTQWPDCRRWVDLHLDNYPTPITVVCFISEDFQNTMIFSNSGQSASYFNKSLSSYVDGFIYDFSYFWIGLNSLKALSDAGLDKLYLNSGSSHPVQGYKSYLRQYNGIRFGDASSSFSFTFTSTNSSDVSYGDCLGPLQGAKFSTFDNDNDQDASANCASQNGMAWWFTDCNIPCKPLGTRYIPMTGLDYVTDVTMAFVTH